MQARKHEEGAGRVKKLNVFAGDKPENCLLHQFSRISRHVSFFGVTVLVLISMLVFAKKPKTIQEKIGPVIAQITK